MSDEPRAPLTTTTSIWPAAGVLIFAVVVLLVFMLINLISDQGVTTTPTTLPVVVGGLARGAVGGRAGLLHQRLGDPDEHRRRLPRARGHDQHRQVATSPTPAPATSTATSRSSRPRTARHCSSSTSPSSRSAAGRSSPRVRARARPSHSSKRPATTASTGSSGSPSRSPPSNLVHWTFRIYQNSETV